MNVVRLIQVTLRDAIGSWFALAGLVTACLLIYFVVLGPVYFVWPEPREQPRAVSDVPHEALSEPTPPPLISPHELPSEIYLDRVRALLPPAPEYVPGNQAEDIDWQEFDAQQTLARNWCVRLVSEREGISQRDASTLLERAEQQGDLASGWVFIDALESIGADAGALEQRRRQQCAALLYLHFVPMDGG